MHQISFPTIALVLRIHELTIQQLFDELTKVVNGDKSGPRSLLADREMCPKLVLLQEKSARPFSGSFKVIVYRTLLASRAFKYLS